MKASYWVSALLPPFYAAQSTETQYVLNPIAHLPTVSVSARLVSAADKLHNVRSILLDFRQVGETVWERFNGGREGTLWYYRALTGTYNRLGATPLVAELNRAVTELEALAGASRHITGR